MKSSSLRFTFTRLFALAVVPLAASSSPLALAAPAAKATFQDDFLGVLGDAEKKILSLEEAVPQDKFKWRPAPGVRSISEAYLHVAFGNYTLTKIATGKEPPADS